ncbi:Transposase [Methylibium sp. T29]|nr:Transposase [Methylibium sp. T29]
MLFVPSLPNTPLTIDALLRVIAERDAEVALLKLMVDKLKLQLARRVREQYGASSEQLDAQLTLITAEAPKASTSAAAQAPRSKPRKPRRDRKLPEHLPRETQVHCPKGYAADTPCGCSECGGKLRQIGEDVAEQLEYVPGRFKVIRHVRPKLACTRCEGIFQAMAPSRPIARGLPGPALLAHVMVAKYCDHTPLYRQSRIYGRDGVDIDRSTMVGWVDQGDELVEPLAAALGRYTLADGKVHADDTPVPVLDPGRGRTKTGRLWVYVRDDRPCGSRMRRRCGSSTRPIVAASIRANTSSATAASCRPMRTRATRSSSTAAASCTQHAWPMRDGTTGTCTRRTSALPARWPSRRCSASPSCTRSKPTSAADRPMSDGENVSSARHRC